MNPPGKDGKVNLRTLEVASPEALTTVPLDVAILNGHWEYTSKLADRIRNTSSWIPLPFQSLSHAIEILNQRFVHIFVTHWHIGTNHEFESDITQLVKNLIKTRGLPGVGSGPLMVATYHTPLSEELRSFLTRTYDCDLTVLRAFQDPVPWIAEQLWMRLPLRS